MCHGWVVTRRTLKLHTESLHRRLMALEECRRMLSCLAHQAQVHRQQLRSDLRAQACMLDELADAARLCSREAARNLLCIVVLVWECVDELSPRRLWADLQMPAFGEPQPA